MISFFAQTYYNYNYLVLLIDHFKWTITPSCKEFIGALEWLWKKIVKTVKVIFLPCLIYFKDNLDINFTWYRSQTYSYSKYLSRKIMLLLLLNRFNGDYNLLINTSHWNFVLYCVLYIYVYVCMRVRFHQ